MTDDEGDLRERERVEECRGCPVGALLEAGGLLRAKMMDFLPPEFVEHSVGARREFLLALRSLIDQALKTQESYLEDYRRQQAERKAGRRGPQKVTVE